LEATAQQIRNANGAAFEIFPYPESIAPAVTSWQPWGPLASTAGGDDSAGEARDQGEEAVQDTRHAACEELLAAEVRRSFEAGRERGIQEGRLAEREAQSAVQQGQDKLRVEQSARLVESFRREQELYLHRVEAEVVRLALAVAARILRREAQMDPLLLTGAVRVALGQLSASTAVRLRVPRTELQLWTEAIGLLPNLTVKPAVVAGEEMQLGDCVIETELGCVDLGVRAQLAEIERGFFDRAGGQRGSGSAHTLDRGKEVKA